MNNTPYNRFVFLCFFLLHELIEFFHVKLCVYNPNKSIPLHAGDRQVRHHETLLLPNRGDHRPRPTVAHDEAQRHRRRRGGGSVKGHRRLGPPGGRHHAPRLVLSSRLSNNKKVFYTSSYLFIKSKLPGGGWRINKVSGYFRSVHGLFSTNKLLAYRFFSIF
jgi:hypothetical protein